MAVYQGMMVRTAEGGMVVLQDGKRLSPARSHTLRNHSPDGFNWGYGGSGPAQLALALLLEETDQETALALYQPFKWKVVAGLPLSGPWLLDSAEIKEAIASLKKSTEEVTP